ncbi:MAG: hypothetical protein AAGJ85_02735, partial [Pseudomonadota bacterium]
MPKYLRDLARPIPRVQSARALQDLIRAFAAKPSLNAVLAVTGTVPLGLLSRENIGEAALSKIDPASPLSELPKTPILELNATERASKAALQLARAGSESSIIITLDDGRPAYIPTRKLLAAVALENAARAKAMAAQKAPVATPEIAETLQ